MREKDVKDVLNREINRRFAGTESIVVSEFGICQGEARVDLAVINGKIHGFEIKSDKDDLDRLPGQLEAYNKVFEQITIVTGLKHLKNVRAMVPTWWGIMCAKENDMGIELTSIRKPKNNPMIEPNALVQLLWQNETLAILEENGFANGLKSKPRRYLWQALVQNITEKKLREIVRTTLKQRDSLRKRNIFRVV